MFSNNESLSLLISFLSLFIQTPPLPEINVNEWWGPRHLKSIQDTSIRPFVVEFNASMIADLRHRLRNTRQMTPPLEGTGSEYGFNTKEIPRWLRYWAEEYPYQDRVVEINKYPQYKTNIQGLDVHFVRVIPKVPIGIEVVPLLVLHGWPSSYLDFYALIPVLTSVSPHRDFVIEVIAASLPGFAFSDGAVRPGFGVDKMAVVLRNLMHRLGHKKFYTHGADWGSVVMSNMATFFPNEVLGYHSSMPTIFSPLQAFARIVGDYFPSLVVRPEVADRMYPLSNFLSKIVRESGYFHLQATKPDTVDIALTDSPAGLLAYFFEKISVGTREYYQHRADGGLELHYTKEQLVDNLMVYWASDSVATAGRIYADSFSPRYFSLRTDSIPSSVPAWILQAKYEISYIPPWMYKLKFPNLVNETVLDTGGHFLALELPVVLAEDIVRAVVEFRRLQHKGKKKEGRNCEVNSDFVDLLCLLQFYKVINLLCI
ncbi:Juvenile hormone epoxide hydrolase [Papilio xuthus]|uniref:microsomal epoxide hydrolase n=1 Tax=Papilio xuthus TaxID=66420 RepID=A0A194PZZ0_PAPXU|nr:Juvenile hormone epoxide hydrolase [Papilio xuthus]